LWRIQPAPIKPNIGPSAKVRVTAVVHEQLDYPSVKDYFQENGFDGTQFNPNTGAKFCQDGELVVRTIVTCLDSYEVHWLSEPDVVEHVSWQPHSCRNHAQFTIIMLGICQPITPGGLNDCFGSYRSYNALKEYLGDQVVRSPNSDAQWENRLSFLTLMFKFVFRYLIQIEDQISQFEYQTRSIFEARRTCKGIKAQKPIWSNEYFMALGKDYVLRRNKYKNRLGGFPLHYAVLLDRLMPDFQAKCLPFRESWFVTKDQRKAGFDCNLAGMRLWVL
jgi:hypothetical protein